jgi:regulator of sigma E protease
MARALLTTNMGDAVLGLGVILLLVLVHEAGHLIAARCAGLPVLTFSVGFGPSIWEAQRGGTTYRFAAIPAGGYVRYLERDVRGGRPLGALAGVLLAGPLTNLAVATVLLCVTSPTSGIANAIVDGCAQTGALLVGVADSLGALFRGDATRLGGPLEVAQLTGLASQAGGVALLRMAALVSLNLAVFNLLPIPILDGGRLAMLAMERLRGRPLHRRVQVWITASGVAVLLALSAVAFANDVARLMA